MISPPTYEIYAVKYAGPFIRPVAKVLWNTDWEKENKINYYIWVVKGNEETFVVDSGVAAPLAQEMGLQGYVSPVHVLARMGIDASDIKKVVITHIHFDHANGIGLFPNGRAPQAPRAHRRGRRPPQPAARGVLEGPTR